MDHTRDAGSEKSSLFSFRKFHKKANNIKFGRDNLEKVVFGMKIPWKSSCIIQIEEKKIEQGFKDKKYFSDFRASIFDCEFSVLPCYLPVRIFQSIFITDLPSSKIVKEIDLNNHLLKGKHV